MADEIERFTSAGEKIISHELTHLIWSNHMDMVAIITKENLLEVVPEFNPIIFVYLGIQNQL